MTALDDARRAYEAAKALEAYFRTDHPMLHSARLLLTNAEAEYRAALIDAAERRFDALGIVVGETVVTVGDGSWQFVIGELVAKVEDGRVQAWNNGGGVWVWADQITPYTAPEAKEMVLYGPTHEHRWCAVKFVPAQPFRLTLTGICPADLDRMTGPITGTFEMARV